MDLATAAENLLSRLDAVVPANLDETLALYEERGWVEALRHLSERGMLTPEGEAEAASVLAEIAGWAAELETDEIESAPDESPTAEGDTPVIL